MHDRLDVIERSEDVGARGRGTPQETDDAVVEGRVLGQVAGNQDRRGARAQDHGVPRSEAALPAEHQAKPDRPPLEDGVDHLGGEQDHEEQPADLRRVDEEQDAEHGHREHERRPQDVRDLAQERPAGAQLVQVLQPFGGGPQHAIACRPHPPRPAGTLPRVRPARSQSEPRDHHEQAGGGEPVGQQERQAEEAHVVAEHHSPA